ncbi:TRAP-type C4-dicarboxylate transport system, small permease component [Rhizobiales bacterium GAS191]|jgi:TRAP-type C4-dicarboxylate transport system permease small subunit|nr:TRAP-type C4-dicarboxylate transport system, small permease component [Rhizobiales bacterium GAS188]SEC72902.1 TRAP-type C4-dicarboxylate transport system, small permease component [Rhizobiales bacterium GAS191]
MSADAPQRAGAALQQAGGVLRQAGGALERAARLVAGLMFAGVFLVFLYKIVMRYAFHEALAWGEEVSVILFIWIIFWANAFILRDKEQISFDLLYHRMPPAGRRLMAILRQLLIGGIMAAALPGALDYIGFLWRERTPVLGLRLDLVYSCFGIFLIAVIVRSLWGIGRLSGRNWRERV